MRRALLPALLALGAIAIATPAAARAQERERTAADWLDDCRRGQGWGNDDDRACEVREVTLPSLNGTLRVDGGPNGGVSLIGWDRKEVKIVARVSANSRSDGEAERMLKEIRVLTDGSVRAEGPRSSRGRGWGVSFDIYLPRRADVTAETTNGGVRAKQVSGRLSLSTTNGGVVLDEVGGDVRAETVNGGVTVRLSGNRFDGERLEASATNGGVRLEIPEGYNARLEAETTNGGLQTDFPITLQGRIDRRISTTLGRGGPLVSVRTVNGGVRIRRI
ncbi:MAG TPA: DUF4097 family beta strand repeat-containing protein [Gemmatimonadaceae bacterium]